MKTEPVRKRRIFGLLVILSSLGFLGIGILGMQTLASMKEAPEKKIITEKPLPVKIMKANPETIIPLITGYGEVKAIEVVAISPEVSGKVTDIHPNLEIGELVRNGETLLKIDTREERLSLQSNSSRLEVLKRNHQLALSEYKRLKKLHKKNRLVTISELERSEQNANAILEQIRQLEYAIDSTKLHIERSSMIAPYDGRVKEVSVEKGQYVQEGQPVVTLANDTLLEIHVSLDSEKAKEMLQFNQLSKTANRFWFTELKAVPVIVAWTQGKEEVKAHGITHRIVAFDSQTRTLKLAVRLSSEINPSASSFPIVEGMFCKVTFPGKSLESVVKIPREAVQYDNKARIAVDKRLKTVPVEVVWTDDRYVYVSSGLQKNDRIILTNLSDPVENTLVEYNDQEVMLANKGR